MTIPANDNKPRLMTPKEAAAATTMSRVLLARMSKEKRFPQPVQIGLKRIAYVRAEVEAWIEPQSMEEQHEDIPNNATQMGGPEILAEFSVELTADLTLFGLRLIKASHGLTTYFPNVNGGGRSASVSPALRAQITELAFNAYEGLTIGQNSSNDRQQPETISVGDDVWHDKWGNGTVSQVDGDRIGVDFPVGGHKRILANFLHPAKADNDNNPDPRLDRIKRFQRRYGGEIHIIPTAGPTLYRATVNGEQVNIGIGDDDQAYTYTIRGGRKPLVESAPLNLINPAVWQGQPVPDRQWYIPDLVPMRQVTLMYGDGGVGKSLLALQIAAAGALSVETLDLEPWAGRVLYLGAEDEAEEFQRRLSSILKAHAKSFDDLQLFRLLSLADADALLSVPDKSGNMQPTPLWLDLAEYAAEFKPKLIVLDTVADLFAGDEIKRGQARQFVGMLRKLAIEIDCAIILLAHPSVSGMTSGTGTSGSTGWSNSARSRLYLTRGEKSDDPDMRILKTMKANYGTVGGEIKLRWKDGAFVLDDGKPSLGSVMLAAKAERVVREAISAMSRSGERVAKTKGINYAPKVISERPEAKGISVKTLEAAMQTLFSNGELKIVMEGPPSKLRQRIILASEDFGPED